MNPTLLTAGSTYVYLTPQGKMRLRFVDMRNNAFAGMQWRFQSGRGFLALPQRHVEEFVWPEGEVPDRELPDGPNVTAGRRAFHAHRRTVGGVDANGKLLPAWPDLSPKERAAWITAAMEGHQSFLETQEGVFHSSTNPA